MLAACAAHDAATAFLETGDRPAAFCALLDAESYEARGEDAINIGVRPRPEILTPREREVTEAATDMTLTAQAIADRFERSSRTIENQLNSIYKKLGVSGREELALLVNGNGCEQPLASSA